jgi:hypothetical protein
MEDMAIEQLQRDVAELWTRNEAQLEDTFACPGGETYAHFRARVVAGFNRAAAIYPAGGVVEEYKQVQVTTDERSARDVVKLLQLSVLMRPGHNKAP